MVKQHQMVTLTPQQRMARMRKSFERNKSVLTADYKYFTTPDKAAKQSAKKQPAQKPVKCQLTR
jgi:hypothetical protein